MEDAALGAEAAGVVVVWVVEVAVVAPATGTAGVAVPLLRTKESIVRFAEMYGNFRSASENVTPLTENIRPLL